jgi:hypothetical protein
MAQIFPFRAYRYNPERGSIMEESCPEVRDLWFPSLGQPIRCKRKGLQFFSLLIAFGEEKGHH